MQQLEIARLHRPEAERQIASAHIQRLRHQTSLPARVSS
jgi:hypothetical protein